jgi:hypothetical protein
MQKARLKIGARPLVLLRSNLELDCGGKDIMLKDFSRVSKYNVGN